MIKSGTSFEDQTVHFGNKSYRRRVWAIRRNIENGQLSGVVRFAGQDWKVYLHGDLDFGHWTTQKPE